MLLLIIFIIISIYQIILIINIIINDEIKHSVSYKWQLEIPVSNSGVYYLY